MKEQSFVSFLLTRTETIHLCNLEISNVYDIYQNVPKHANFMQIVLFRHKFKRSDSDISIRSQVLNISIMPWQHFRKVFIISFPSLATTTNGIPKKQKFDH